MYFIMHVPMQRLIIPDLWILLSIIDEYPNLDLIGNARIDSVMYDPAPAQTGRRGRPAKHGKRSGLFATIWCEAAKGLKCWLI